MAIFSKSTKAMFQQLFLLLLCHYVNGFASHRLGATKLQRQSAAIQNHPLVSSISLTVNTRHGSLLQSSAAAAVTVNVTATATKDDYGIPFVRNVIVGGGPAGLLTAIMLAQQQDGGGGRNERHTASSSSSSSSSTTLSSSPTSNTHAIHVYDRQPHAAPSPDDFDAWNADAAKYYLIGLGGRGQLALQQLGVWNQVKQHCVAVVGRKDWPPGASEGVERVFTKRDKKTTAQVLPREKLVGILQQVIQTQYSQQVVIHYGCQVEPIEFDYKNGESVLLQVTKCVAASDNNVDRSMTPSSSATTPDIFCSVNDETNPPSLLEAGFVIAADGTQRTFANAMEQASRARNLLARLTQPRPIKVKRYLDDNQRVYKTIPLKLPSDWRFDLNYSARTKGSKMNLDALPANANGDYCGVLLLLANDPLAQANTCATQLRGRMDKELPQFSALMSDEVTAAVAIKPVSFLPAFRYVGPRLHQGKRCLILGDCAHTVKPYFGLGANSALEDVLVLQDVLTQCGGDVTVAVPEFSKRRAPEAKTMVRLSRELDRPGKLGFVTFILPIILDSIFHGLAPRLFTPNIIAMMQREEYTFTQVARRKRIDRTLQVAIIVGGLGATGWLVNVGIQALAAALNRSAKTTATITFAAAACIIALQKLVPGLGFRAILSSMAGRITNSRTHLTPLRNWLARWNSNEGGRNGESFLTPLGFQNKDANNSTDKAI
ncbi:hypothetical protein MPSEU_000553300 [Mayamaea pseudoterrestris]|nr:hypothetical protein MPSEU_000553300 [Mayamaea pseudoterrestris]